MIADYEISLGRVGDIPRILALQETSLVERGGSLSVRQTGDWFRQAIVEKSLVVGRHDQKVRWLCLGDIARGQYARDDYPDYAARLPAAA